MNARIFQVLDPDRVRHLASALAAESFADGRATATGMAREVKRNLQFEHTGPEPTARERIVLDALAGHAEFRSFALPKRLTMPRFARYSPGMEYGTHLDDAVMGTAPAAIRTDLSLTLFLAEPDTYDGGELVLELPLGEQEIKLAAGEAVVYPSTTLHRVAPVTRGERLVCIAWVESLVRDEGLRAILFDLAQSSALAEQRGQRDLATLTARSYHNLLRRYAET